MTKKEREKEMDIKRKTYHVIVQFGELKGTL